MINRRPRWSALEAIDQVRDLDVSKLELSKKISEAERLSISLSGCVEESMRLMLHEEEAYGDLLAAYRGLAALCISVLEAQEQPAIEGGVPEDASELEGELESEGLGGEQLAPREGSRKGGVPEGWSDIYEPYKAALEELKTRLDEKAREQELEEKQKSGWYLQVKNKSTQVRKQLSEFTDKIKRQRTSFDVAPIETEAAHPSDEERYAELLEELGMKLFEQSGGEAYDPDAYEFIHEQKRQWELVHKKQLANLEAIKTCKKALLELGVEEPIVGTIRRWNERMRELERRREYYLHDYGVKLAQLPQLLHYKDYEVIEHLRLIAEQKQELEKEIASYGREAWLEEIKSAQVLFAANARTIADLQDACSTKNFEIKHLEEENRHIEAFLDALFLTKLQKRR